MNMLRDDSTDFNFLEISGQHTPKPCRKAVGIMFGVENSGIESGPVWNRQKRPIDHRVTILRVNQLHDG